MYDKALDLPIFPDNKAHAVTAGLKWPPDILPPNPMAIAKAATIRTGTPVKEMVPIKSDVPRNSTRAGDSIYTKNHILL
jgi:hypothetical protein